MSKQPKNTHSAPSVISSLTLSATGQTSGYRTKYLYDGWNLLAELDGANNLVRSHMWGLDLSGSIQGAGGVGGLLAVNTASQGAHFCAYDGNGNVAGLVSADDGTISALYEYRPCGELIRATGPMAKANPFRFSTKYQDDESDMLYYGYRYYSASMGRWLNRDPIEELGGLNLYGFLDGDALNNFDPDGQSVVSWLGGKCVKKGVKETLKKFIKERIKDRLTKMPDKAARKRFADEADEIIDLIESEWWETCLSLCPIVGDAYDLGSLSFKIRKAWRKADNLEDTVERAIPNILKKGTPGKFKGKDGWFDDKGNFISIGDKPGEFHVFPSPGNKNPLWDGSPPRGGSKQPYWNVDGDGNITH